ncbi:MAG: aminomethyl-transferring glycine dehydrogenase subunit GcvPA [Spirochaetota bacterium]|nr:aminomethyl-transferring glycine dehydrogenase subunit GcvPA [Spirochaetota bacterium]
MNYTPHTQQEINEMLKVIGMKSLDELFNHLPQKLFDMADIKLEKGMSEMDVSKYLNNLAKKNSSFSDKPGFLGGGVYDHYVPPAVDALANRAEFYTAYTPYQPEASQGALQAIIEYQTAIARLTKMDIANASLYDGSSSLAEAILMAMEVTGKDEVIISETTHPEWIEVVKAYLAGRDVTIHLVKASDGESDFKAIKSLVSAETACVCIQSPNFYGVVEDYRELKSSLSESKALLVVGCYPLSLGYLEPPGSFGADIVVGDGQSLGNYMAFGGPHFGFLACGQEYVRKIPGRIVGQTEDSLSQRGYCLTFQTREQHIRREKATSNICSNHALMALRSVIYLSLLGEAGLHEAARLSYHKAHYLYKKVIELPAFEPVFDKPFFNEFVVRSKVPALAVNQALFNEGFIGGLALNTVGDYDENLIMFAVTEKRGKDELDGFIRVLKKFN